MSSRNSSLAISTGLIGTGMVAWALAGRPLAADKDLAVPLNPLGINRSPYGEVFAMAMQGPIDKNFHVGVLGQHIHQNGETCDACKKSAEANAAASPGRKAAPTLLARFQNTLTSLGKLSEVRTNPKPAGPALRFHLRREAENKLRFAYQLDPSNYANYNSLHFFLTEPAVGTRPELTPTAAKLAEETIQYCLKQQDDPRPALTAAAACTNVLHLMFNDRRNPEPKYSTAQMRQCLDLLDHCVSRYDHLAAEWDASGQWNQLSKQRFDECEERIRFIRKVRDAAEETILIHEGKAQPQQASN